MPRKARAPGGQLDLFALDPLPEDPRVASHHDAGLELRFARLRAVASRLPPQVHFGTSSWSFPGWAGLVFPHGCTKSFLAKEGLPLYVRHPLLRTVGIDRGYYAAIPSADLAMYAQQLPPGFPCCAKVPGAFTAPVHLGFGPERRGEPNPAFLDAARFHDTVAGPFLDTFRDHTAALILEFPPLPPSHKISPQAFPEKLDAFLECIPSELPCCVELRDPHLLTPSYARVLARHSASHVYNYWSAMPMPETQRSIVPLDNAPFAVVRLLLRPGSRYAQRQAAFDPFDRIVDPDAAMRDQVLDLLREAIRTQRNVFVLVNNKAEGSAPLTIEELAQSLADNPARAPDPVPYCT